MVRRIECVPGIAQNQMTVIHVGVVDIRWVSWKQTVEDMFRADDVNKNIDCVKVRQYRYSQSEG